MQHVDTKIEVARTGFAAVGVTVYGLTLNEWVAIITVIYLAVQIVILLPKFCGTLKNFIKRIRGGYASDA